MICSHIVNLSLMLGALLSWGIMWPLISELKGDWFSASIPQSSMRSLQGYKVHVLVEFPRPPNHYFWATLFNCRLLKYLSAFLGLHLHRPYLWRWAL